MANFYLITFDPGRGDSASLHEVIKNSTTFLNWWHYLSSVYLVKTRENLAGVHRELQTKWPDNRYLIIKVDPTYRNGWLAPDAWSWFRKQVDR